MLRRSAHALPAKILGLSMPLRHIACFTIAALTSTVWAADDTDTPLETIIVTANRTADIGATLGQAWSALSAEDVAVVDLQHSNQLFNRVSGAWVSRGNGQESLISLRSPVLTGAGACGAFSLPKMASICVHPAFVT
jgi:hypothetical protein